MRIVRGLESYPPDASPAAVALGTFDGIHLAHRAILAAAVAQARSSHLQALACTFEPHPAEVLHPGQAPAPISTLGERLELLAETGVDATVVVDFTAELAVVEPEAFVKDVLLDRLHAHDVVVGYNHTFGRGARGNARLLQELAAQLGFRAHVVPPLLLDGVPVSSSEIRTALRAGDVERARRYLGRSYSITGQVVEGAGRGRTLGFPTANVKPDRSVLVAPGVYACQIRLGGEARAAVVNVGMRPTFGETALVIEAHLLDFSGSLYGQPLRVEFVSRIREERRFPGPEALREQISRDIATARQRL
jgi:riboflavin kinase/FMN adenylyltransferase